MGSIRRCSKMKMTHLFAWMSRCIYLISSMMPLFNSIHHKSSFVYIDDAPAWSLPMLFFHLYKDYFSHWFLSIINYSLNMNTQQNNQQQVMVLVPMDTYLQAGLNTTWIHRQLQQTPVVTTASARPSIDSLEPVKKKVHSLSHFTYLSLFFWYHLEHNNKTNSEKSLSTYLKYFSFIISSRNQLCHRCLLNLQPLHFHH